MNNTNLILSIILSIAIIIGWQFLYERPRLQNLSVEKTHQIEQKNDFLETQQESIKIIDINQALLEKDRVKIKNDNITGSINLIGARFDDLVLLQYKDEIDSDKNVRIFAPSQTKLSYFAEIGWCGANANTELPNSQTLWSANSKVLTPEKPVTLSWTNSDGIEFIIKASLDEQYMFCVEQEIKNHTNKNLDIRAYTLLNRNYESDKSDSILHKGPIAVINNELKEFSYSKLKENKKKVFSQVTSNWLGITDKYWLAAFICEQADNSNVNFNYSLIDGMEKFQVDMVNQTQLLTTNQELNNKTRLFVGAKEVKLLDHYAKKYNIKLFDRAIDFGWLYIITKPLFYTMSFFYEIFGNFGLSIMMVTILIKLCMFGISTKSGKSMKKLKEIQPKVEALKTKYENNKMLLNQEILALYKRENVNPLSGCLPLLIQIPVFFSIYKVLYVTIEMRHAPFYGWIQDLSAADPTSFANLFGLLAFSPPSFLQIGIWPILMSASMFIQQQLSGNTSMDATQAQIMKLLPLIFLVTFASFPAGLLIYWTWSNFLSIVQQLYINKYVK